MLEKLIAGLQNWAKVDPSLERNKEGLLCKVYKVADYDIL